MQNFKPFHFLLLSIINKKVNFNKFDNIRTFLRNSPLEFHCFKMEPPSFKATS